MGCGSVAQRLLSLLSFHVATAHSIAAWSEAMLVTEPPRPQTTLFPYVEVARRVDSSFIGPVDRADFIGYKLMADGSFSAEFCYTQGDTVTTINTVIDCCPPGKSCYAGIGCSASYLINSILTSPATDKTTKSDCAAFAVPGTTCETRLVHEDLQVAEASTTQYGTRYVWIGCGNQPVPGLGTRDRYYRTLTAGAEVNLTLPTWSVGETRTTTSFLGAPSEISSSTSPGASATAKTDPTSGSVSTGNPSQSGASTSLGAAGTGRASSTGGSDSTGNEASQSSDGSDVQSSEIPGSSSSATLSRSDQIAIGVGLGIGIPTVLVAILGWLYPRHRWRQGFLLRKASSTLVSMSTPSAAPPSPRPPAWGAAVASNAPPPMSYAPTAPSPGASAARYPATGAPGTGAPAPVVGVPNLVSSS